MRITKHYSFSTGRMENTAEIKWATHVYGLNCITDVVQQWCRKQVAKLTFLMTVTKGRNLLQPRLGLKWFTPQTAIQEMILSSWMHLHINMKNSDKDLAQDVSNFIWRWYMKACTLIWQMQGCSGRWYMSYTTFWFFNNSVYPLKL